ncbi:hypothetical protein [Nocardia sp. JMUB6875]|uniref:DUF6881 domain-containing protein n=1 Tax=Nocardia sp. JMUB6875 TaxID=3158170 RepID=UPI0034E8BA2F
MLRQQELIGEIVEYLREYSSLEWIEISATFRAAGAVVGLDVAVETPDGRLSDMGEPVIIPREVAELRKLMYISGLGTWFTFNLRILRAGDFFVDFDYDRPSPQPLLWLDFAGDLDMFPRKEVPAWMLDEVENQRVEEASEACTDWLWEQDERTSESGWTDHAREKMDRSLAVQRAAGFIPEDPGCLYIEISNELGADDIPAVSFCELWENRFQRRRIEIYRDGAVGLADEYRTEGCFRCEPGEHTLLDEDPLPSPSGLSEESGISAREISPVEFQTEWLAAGGW